MSILYYIPITGVALGIILLFKKRDGRIKNKIAESFLVDLSIMIIIFVVL
tara:strand:+ start:172 stop:321 length:150 start_codon:yes stop_codon:yes gene_type:complete